MASWDSFPLAHEADPWSAFPVAGDGKKPAQNDPNAFVDAIRSIPGGLAKGVAGVAGLPGDMQDLLDSGANWALSKITGEPVNLSTRGALSPPSSGQINEAVSEPFGGYYEPQTTAGHYAETISSFAPAALAPGSVAQRAMRVLVPGAASETAGQMTKGKPYEPAARAIGALAGGIGEGFGEGYVANRSVPKANKVVSELLSRDKIDRPAAFSQISGDPYGELTLLDLAGANSAAQRAARGLVTMPGPQSKQITDALNERAAGQYGRVSDTIKQSLHGNSDTYGSFDALSQKRLQDSAPLYKDAFSGGSIAPLEDQFRSHLMAATGQKGSLAKAIKSIEDNNPGALAARGAAGAATREKYMELRQQLDEAENARQEALSIFQRAQADKTANAPGAVWNPRIQQFLDDPIIQQGIHKGLEVQRLEALADGKKFNPTEYAVVGADEAGKPIVGTVPNMRLLDAAKRGLDEILEGYRDSTTRKLNLDQRGRAVDSVRKALISELDAVNPRYKAARDAWGGPSQSMSALSLGQDFLQRDPEEITKIMASLSPSDAEFYKMGASRVLQDKAASAADNADLTKRLFGNPDIRKKIATVFGPAGADSFGKRMSDERQLFDTRQFVLGGSQTANKAGDLFEGSAMQKALGDAVQGGVAGLIGGGPKGAALGAVGLPLANITRRVAGSIAEKGALSDPTTAQLLADALLAKGPTGAAFLEKNVPQLQKSGTTSASLLANLLLSQQGAR